MSEDLTTDLAIFLNTVLRGGPDGYVLTATGFGSPVDWEAGGGGGSGTGDVVGPSSSVDNTIARYDGTTGKLLQGYTSGGPTISDLGILGVTVGAQFGATGQVNAIYDVTSETVTDLIDIRHEFATVTTDLAFGLGMFITFNPGSNVSGAVFGFNVEARTKAGNTKTFAYVDGGDTDVYIFGSGDVGEAVGGTHSAQIAQSDGTGGAKVSLAVGARAKVTNHLTVGSGKQVLLARGVEAQINNENTSVMPQADAVWAQVVNEGGGRIASAAALRAVAPVLTNGSGTNFIYGLYIEDQTAAVDSGNYQIYSAGNLHSYFAGPVEMLSLATSAASPLLLTNGKLVTIALTTQTVNPTTLTIPNFASVSDSFAFLALAQTFTNKRITLREVSVADATTITPNCDTSDVVTQANTQTAGTLTLANATGTPTASQRLYVRVKTTNQQTWAFGTEYRGSDENPLPSVTTIAKYDYLAFARHSVDSKWDLLAVNRGF